jgi:CRP/FNR family transcriptional regulator
MYAYAAQQAQPALDIAALSVCRGLERSAAARIGAISSLHKIAAHKTVFCEGDSAENVYEVVKGVLKLYKLLPDGRRQVTGFLAAGHLLGLAHDERYLYTAEAVTAVTLCRYPRSRFERLVDEVPGFARRLLAVTSDELRAAQDQMLLLGRKGAAEKIASFLLMTAERQCGDGAEDAEAVEIEMSRNDIADYLGLTMETVSRTFTQLKREKVIALPTPCQVQLLDHDRLEQLASGDLDSEL